MNILKDITVERLSKSVVQSYCWRDLLIKLGYSKNSGSMYKYVQQKVKMFNINTDHFDSHKKNKSKFNRIYKDEEIFCKNSKYKAINYLRMKIINEKLIDYVCICGQGPIWNGNPLTLQLDHINGDNTDHRIENLRFLCPNCHTQTKTYGSKRLKKNICKKCGKHLEGKRKTNLCFKCLYPNSNS